MIDLWLVYLMILYMILGDFRMFMIFATPPRKYVTDNIKGKFHMDDYA